MTTTEAFETWWAEQGQFCRAGGGDYEKTFAFRAFEFATERAAKQEREECALVAQGMLDLEGDVGADDWNAEMGWDWACQKIRDAIRNRDGGTQG
jgi:hypothetical protein